MSSREDEKDRSKDIKKRQIAGGIRIGIKEKEGIYAKRWRVESKNNLITP